VNRAVTPVGSTVSVVLVSLVGAGSALAAMGVDLELGIGAGHDNALFRLASVIPTNATTADWYWEAQPRIAFNVEPSASQRLDLKYDGGFRDFTNSDNGWAHAHALRAAYGLDLTPALALRVTASGAIDIPEGVDAGYHTGAAGVGPVWHVTPHADIGLELEGQRLDSPVIHDWFEGVTVHGAWSTSTLELGARLQGFTDGAGWRQVAGFASAAKSLGPVRLEANGGAATVSDGRWALFGGAAGVDLASRWAVTLRYAGRYETYTSTPTPIVAHELGVAVHWAWDSVGASRTPRLDAVRSQATPAVVVAGVEVSLATSTAVRGVAIVGDFNGWDRNATPLSQVEPGVWRVHLDLPPGHYAYQIVIDGEARVPAGAKRYIDDAFGGQNASLGVMTQASVETLTCLP
jgi:hypothetical protein